LEEPNRFEVLVGRAAKRSELSVEPVPFGEQSRNKPRDLRPKLIECKPG
jgi:hypothetical protein